MALMRKRYFAWAEPWFFVLRIRTTREWLVLSAICFGLAAVVTVVAMLVPGPQFNVANLLTLFGGVAIVAWYLIDGNSLFRSVSIDDKDITIVAEGGYNHATITNIPFAAIKDAHLVRATSAQKPYGAMILNLGKQSCLLAVPKVIDLERLAQTLHSFGVDVRLEGWVAKSGPISDVAESLSFDFNANVATADALITNIEQSEPRLVTTADRVVAGLLAGWPLLVSAIALLVGIGFAIWSWNAFSILQRCLWIGIPVLLAFFSFVLVSRYANFIETGYLIRKCKKALLGRSTAIVPDVENCLPIMHIDRAQWTNLMPDSSDMGFLMADIQNKRFLFEGNKHRWEIPLGSIQKCQLESVDVGTQTDTGKQAKRWMVNLTAQESGKARELGIRLSNTYVGAEDNAQRERLAVEIFDYLAVTIERMRR